MKRKFTLKKTVKWVFNLSLFYLFFSFFMGIGPSPIPFNQYTIRTGSMSGVFEVGAMVIVQTNVPIEDLSERDIIIFNADILDSGTEERVIHFIDSITQVNGTWEITTISNVSNTPDPWVLGEEDVIGLYRAHIEGLGRFLFFLQTPMGRGIMLFNLGVFAIIMWLLKDPKTPLFAKRVEAEEIEYAEVEKLKNRSTQDD